MDDPYGLQRFVDAQADVFDDVVAELGDGRKRTHWMWFVFPQIEGLGSSAMSRRYAIANAAEARAYLDHPLLGDRLRECTRLVNAIEHGSLRDVLGQPDDAKFHSSMTLFDAVADAHSPFGEALLRWFGGRRDPRTLQRLQRSAR